MQTENGTVWSDQLQAFVRVEAPDEPGSDKHTWEFADQADDERYCRRMSAEQAEQASALKADARWHCEQARSARNDGRRRHFAEHLSDAIRLTRLARGVGEQARLNRARAERLHTRQAAE